MIHIKNDLSIYLAVFVNLLTAVRKRSSHKNDLSIYMVVLVILLIAVSNMKSNYHPIFFTNSGAKFKKVFVRKVND